MPALIETTAEFRECMSNCAPQRIMWQLSISTRIPDNSCQWKMPQESKSPDNQIIQKRNIMWWVVTLKPEYLCKIALPVGSYFQYQERFHQMSRVEKHPGTIRNLKLSSVVMIRSVTKLASTADTLNPKGYCHNCSRHFLCYFLKLFYLNLILI